MTNRASIMKLTKAMYEGYEFVNIAQAYSYEEIIETPEDNKSTQEHVAFNLIDNGFLNTKQLVYLFMVNNTITYIGVLNQLFRSQYLTESKCLLSGTHLTSKILEQLKKNKIVSLWLLIDSLPDQADQMVNMAESILSEMIIAIKPAWNNIDKPIATPIAQRDVLQESRSMTVAAIVNILEADQKTSPFCIDYIAHKQAFIFYLQNDIGLTGSLIAAYIRCLRIIPYELKIPITPAFIENQSIVDGICQHFTTERESNAQNAIQHYYYFLKKFELCACNYSHKDALSTDHKVKTSAKWI